MATVNLGNIKLNWKGAYNSSTAYIVDDVVSYNGSSYVCIQASTNNLPTNTTYWNQMSAKGTDGTDIGTTLTTQGDILYRDGSGLQRLPKGTAGQVLKMNSGATAPEYGTVSSDWVKLGSTTLGSDASNIQVDNLFDYSTYKYYAVQFNGYTNNNGGWINGRAINSSGTVQSSAHYTILNRAVINGSGSSDGTSSDWNGDRWFIVQSSNDATKPSSGLLYIMNADSTSQWKMIINTSLGWDGTTQLQAGDGGHTWGDTGTMRGIEIFCNGGNLKSGFKVEVYGIK